MRILAVTTRDLFRLTLGWSLEELGHTVYYVARIREDLLELSIRSFQPDLILTIGWDLRIDQAELVGRVAKVNRVFHLYFAEEDWLHVKTCSLPFCSAARPNLVLTRSRACLPYYAHLGIPALFFNVACNPSFHRSTDSDSRFQCDVAVVANPQLRQSALRRKSVEDLVVPLLGTAMDVRIWGKGWASELKEVCGAQPQPHTLHGVLPFYWTVHVYNSAAINIGIQTVEDQLSNRTYDILASGGFLLTSDTKAVQEHFQSGVHCVVVRSAAEATDGVTHYLHADDERQRIARAGQQLVVQKFSYQKTLPKIWGDIERAVRTGVDCQ